MKYRKNLVIRIIIIFLISFSIYYQNNKRIEDNNSLEYYFSYSICNFLIFRMNYNCSNNIFMDKNFYENILEINQKINLFINIKKTKIENIFLLIGIVPFLKNNSSIIYKINKKEIFKLFKNIFKKIKIKNKIIKINENNFKFFIEKFNELINYKWEIIPTKTISNNIRYIINNYFNESCLEIFDKSLNFNFKYYLKNRKKQFSSGEINDLISKFYIIKNKLYSQKILEFMKKKNVQEKEVLGELVNNLLNIILQVYKCKCLLNEENYALKEIPKYKLYSYNRIFSNLNEPLILKKFITYDFLPRLISSFIDYDYIYLVTTYYEGKSLDYFREQLLTEEQIKFVSACVIQSLIYLRKEKIIHRDIMMKNIIMDNKNYFNVIDFSFSINYLDKNNKRNSMITYNMVTPPEIINNSEYDYNSDYYRLGSVIYYLIFKKYPYILKKENNITDILIDYKYIKNYTYSCINFLNKLLISDYKKRIGFKSVEELVNHSWFKGFDWTMLEEKRMISPFKFIKNGFKESQCTKFIIPIRYITKYQKQLNKNIYKKLIKKFEFANSLIIDNFIKY